MFQNEINDSNYIKFSKAELESISSENCYLKDSFEEIKRRNIELSSLAYEKEKEVEIIKLYIEKLPHEEEFKSVVNSNKLLNQQINKLELINENITKRTVDNGEHIEKLSSMLENASKREILLIRKLNNLTFGESHKEDAEITNQDNFDELRPEYICDLEHRIAELESNKVNMQNEINAITNAKNCDIIKLQNINKMLSEKNSVLNLHVSRLTGENSVMMQENETLKGQIKSMKTYISSIENKKLLLESRCKALEKFWTDSYAGTFIREYWKKVGKICCLIDHISTINIDLIEGRPLNINFLIDFDPNENNLEQEIPDYLPPSIDYALNKKDWSSENHTKAVENILSMLNKRESMLTKLNSKILDSYASLRKFR